MFTSRLTRNLYRFVGRSTVKSCSTREGQGAKFHLQQRLLMSTESTPKAKTAPKKRSDGDGKGPISWRTVGITVGLGGALILGMNYVKKEKEMKIAKERSRTIGQASLGGEWELIDHHGNKVKSSDYLGKWFMIYFGFCHCPDICPDELEKLCSAVDKLDAIKTLPKLHPLFITIDPERDTAPLIKEYVKEFSSKLLGLTGTKEQIHQTSRAYRVYYSQGPKDEDGGYIVDHTIVMYLVNPDGKFTDYYGQNKTDNEIVSNVMMHMQRYQQLNS
ncbi:protein SCO1 homolog, mitochondrial-like [Tubulanus polymorphus]|uniref:protein SCO1 homolog, mitochondrial-like n=1 Tax=Tubulanus polymorphus TaxID=672921 RepID=UPI003DA2AFEF